MSKKINWDDVFERHSTSPLSDLNFCKQEKIATTSFYLQKKARGLIGKGRRKRSSPNTKKNQFIEIGFSPKVGKPERKPTLVFKNPNGLVLEVFL